MGARRRRINQALATGNLDQFKEDEEYPREAALSGKSDVEKRRYEAGVAALKLVERQRKNRGRGGMMWLMALIAAGTLGTLVLLAFLMASASG